MGRIRPFGARELGDGRLADDETTVVPIEQWIGDECIGEDLVNATEPGDFKIPVEEASRIEERFRGNWQERQGTPTTGPARDEPGAVPRAARTGD